MNTINDITKHYSLDQLRASQGTHRANRRAADQEERIKDHTPGEYTPYQAIEPTYLQPAEARILIYRIMQHLIGSSKIIMTPHNGRALRHIINYLCTMYADVDELEVTYDHCIYDQCMCHALHTDKGLYIYGDYRRGKTTIIDTIHRLCKKASSHYHNIKSWTRIDYKSTVANMKRDKIDTFTSKQYPHLIIDDLGFMADGTQLQIYGNKINLVQDIIYERHRSHAYNKDIKTIITSNLTPHDILEQYGEGVYSRLYEMCNFIAWDGDNLSIKK